MFTPLSRLFLRGLIYLWMLCVPGLALATVDAKSQQDARHIVHILSYVAGDYGGAVRNGEVLSAAEYTEQQEFVQSAADLLGGLQTDPAMLAQMADLRAAIADKADAAVVQRRANDLRARLTTDFQLQTAPRGTPALTRGRQLFNSNCVSCHGAQGMGDGAQGRGLDPAPANFHDRESIDKKSPFDFANTIRFGVTGTGMPPFAQLSEADIWALAFYVASLRYSADELQSGKQAFTADRVQWLDRFGLLAGLASQSDAAMAVGQGAQARAVVAYLRTYPEALSGSDAGLMLTRLRLKESLDAFLAGRADAAYRLAVSAYLDGFEPIEPSVNVLDPALRTRVEEVMIGYRSAIRGGQVETVEQAYAAVLSRLSAVESLLSKEGLSVEAGFISALTILLREGLEAVLVVGAIITLLIRTNRRDALRYIHIGWVSALLLGFATWWMAKSLITVTGASRELIEGVGAMLAVVILFYVSFWLLKNLEEEKWRRFIREKIEKAAGAGSMWGLLALTFLAVYREIFESVLFYQALWAQASSQQSQNAILGGIGVALLVLVLLMWAMFRLGVRLPLKPFFAVNSAILYTLAFVFAGKGVRALQEVGWIDVTPVDFARIEILGIFPSLEGLALQGGLVVAIVLALAYTFWWQAKPQPVRP